MILILVAGDEQLLQGAPATEGVVVLEAEAAGGRRGTASLGGELAGGPAVFLLVGSARYEAADGAHCRPGAAGGAAAGARARRGVGWQRPALLDVETWVGVVSHGHRECLNQSHGAPTASDTPRTLRRESDR